MYSNFTTRADCVEYKYPLLYSTNLIQKVCIVWRVLNWVPINQFNWGRIEGFAPTLYHLAGRCDDIILTLDDVLHKKMNSMCIKVLLSFTLLVTSVNAIGQVNILYNYISWLRLECLDHIKAFVDVFSSFILIRMLYAHRIEGKETLLFTQSGVMMLFISLE